MGIADVLSAQGKLAVEQIRGAISKVDATQKTKQSVRFESDESKLTIFARAFTELLNIGRNPTKKGPSPEMIANITEYAEARGMENPESAAWAIAKTINKLGDKTHRKGGRDVYETAVKKSIENISNAVILFKMREAKDKVMESLKEVK